MNPDDTNIRRGKIILSISMLCLLISIGLFVVKNTDIYSNKEYTLVYQTINIKTMGAPKVSLKKTKKDNIFTTIVSAIQTNSTLKEVTLNETPVEKEEPVKVQTLSSPVQTKPVVTKPTWRLPTEQGYITQRMHYNHIALDITSARGTNERIYPVADGVVTSIFQDSYGAKIVTVNHYINGNYYTSQYVHLSWYAPGLHVGQEVTTDTVLGGMGATGIATGIHLHITVLDCNLYAYNDPNCATLNQFYNYGKVRVSQGFRGLDSLMGVPYSWYSR